MAYGPVNVPGSDNVKKSEGLPYSLSLTMNGSASSYKGTSSVSKTWYAPTTSGTKGQVLTSNGSGAPIWEDPLDSGNSAEQHRMIFRGKNLGSTFTSEQKSNIQNGSFKDLYVGDYWKMGDVTYRIADIDYWYGCGFFDELTDHHLIIIPDGSLYRGPMDSSGKTDNGYSGSTMNTSGLTQAETQVKNAFGSDSVLIHDSYFVNKVTDGVPTGSSYDSVYLEIPNERMVYGTEILAAPSSGSAYSSGYTFSKTQLALFMIAPKFIISRDKDGEREYWWLRDVVTSSFFAFVTHVGYASCYSALASRGVRPVFAIG